MSPHTIIDLQGSPVVRRRSLAIGLFWVGVLLLLVHTTFPALWQVVGFSADYPLASTEGVLGISAGFTPPLGTALMLVAGFIYGSGPSARSGR